jgi:hypothetical protein
MLAITIIFNSHIYDSRVLFEITIKITLPKLIINLEREIVKIINNYFLIFSKLTFY